MTRGFFGGRPTQTLGEEQAVAPVDLGVLQADLVSLTRLSSSSLPDPLIWERWPHPLSRAPLSSSLRRAKSLPLRASGVSSATLALTAPALFVSGGYASTVLADSPYAYWRLGESAGTTIEEENNAYDGTYVTGGTLAQTGALTGDANTAVTFDGVDDYGTLTTVGSFGSNLLTATIELWVKTTSTALDTMLGTVSTGTATLVRMSLNSQTGSNNIAGSTCLQLRGAGSANQLTGYITTNIYDGGWHHLVWVIQGSAVAHKCWVDGVERTVVMGTTQAIAPANFEFPVALGAINIRGVIGEWGAATLDEVALYTSRLSEARIQTHYTAGTSVAGGLVASGQSSATLALSAPAKLALEAASATSSATLLVTAATKITLGASSGVSSATLSLTALTKITLGAASGQSSATLALTAQTYIALSSASGVSSATLVVTVPSGVPIPMAAANAVSSATLVLRAPALLVLEAASGASSTTLFVTARTYIVLAPANAVSSTGTLGSVGPEVPIPDTPVPLGGEELNAEITGATATEYVRGATAVEMTTGADPTAILGAEVVEYNRSGVVTEPSLGVVEVGLLGAVELNTLHGVTEMNAELTGGTATNLLGVVELNDEPTSGEADEGVLVGVATESERSGDDDDTTTGGDDNP